MDFEQAHRLFIEQHLKRRKGERHGRLERGHGHAEKLFLQNIWWELKGNFDGLHPEFELVDWRGRSFYGDFLYIPRHGRIKFILEIKGYNTHVKEMDRQGFANECKRELFLEGMGYRVISFAYDDVRDQPQLIVAMLRMLLSLYEPADTAQKYTFAEHEIIRLALQLVRPVRPKDVTGALSMSYRKALGLLQSLSQRGVFKPATGADGKRIVRYELMRNPFE